MPCCLRASRTHTPCAATQRKRNDTTQSRWRASPGSAVERASRPIRSAAAGPAIAAETGDTLRALHDYEQLLQVVAASSLSGKPPAYLRLEPRHLLAQLARYPEALAALDEAIELARQQRQHGRHRHCGSGARGHPCLDGGRSGCRARAAGPGVADRVDGRADSTLIQRVTARARANRGGRGSSARRRSQAIPSSSHCRTSRT